MTSFIVVGKRCPKCGNPAVGSGDQTLDAVDTSGWETACGECPDYACPNCHLIFGGESAYGDAPIGYYTDDGEYKVINCLDSDLMVILSPYYTRAQFCSPCCPGAGSLDNPMADGIKTYCLGQDWFEDGQAPYPVFRLADDVLIPNSPLPKTCDQCAALGINGVFCHETGCPNVRKVWDGVAGEWVTPAADDIEQDDNGLDSLED